MTQQHAFYVADLLTFLQLCRVRAQELMQDDKAITVLHLACLDLWSKLEKFNDSLEVFESQLRQHLICAYEQDVPITTVTPTTYRRLGVNGRGRATGSGKHLVPPPSSSRTTRKSSGSSASSPGVISVALPPPSAWAGRTRRTYRRTSTTTGVTSHPMTPPDCLCDEQETCMHCDE